MKAILFDLDNTLVLYDEARFYDRYFKELANTFSQIMPEEEFFERMINATRILLRGDGRKMNAELFLDAFVDGNDAVRDEIWTLFLNFYANDYDRLKDEVSIPDSIGEVFDLLKTIETKLVLASNPIFPLEVQIKRLAWGGLDYLPFDFITHIENMSFCKPKVEYYVEICGKIDVNPEECLMVGNDPVNDMAAALAGIKTYLTDDAGKTGYSALALSEGFREEKNMEIPEPDFRGPLSGLPTLLLGRDSRTN